MRFSANSAEDNYILGRVGFDDVVILSGKDEDSTVNFPYGDLTAPRLTGTDVIYLTTDLMMDNQNSLHDHGNRIMIPVNVNPGGIIHYSVDAEEESIPFTFYQDVQTIHIKLIDGAGNHIPDTRGSPIFLRFRFHFRH